MPNADLVRSKGEVSLIAECSEPEQPLRSSLRALIVTGDARTPRRSSRSLRDSSQRADLPRANLPMLEVGATKPGA
jgi:hypothetical protein